MSDEETTGKGENQSGVLRKAYEVLEAQGKRILPMADNLLKNDTTIQKLRDMLRLPPGENTGTAKLDAALESEPVRRLQREINTRIDSIDRLTRTMFERKESDENGPTTRALRMEMAALKKEKDLAFILENIHVAAAQVVLEDEALRTQFTSTEACPMYVMSVDIRRSTDLMLKAKTAQHFADFITDLCEDLTAIVKRRYGVIDKFTGDGILCFFPEFFSGEDAGFMAIAAAEKCHEKFEDHYRNSRGSFGSLMKDVGLGVGIDYGPCHLVQVAGGLTVVGPAAVYACRFAGAPAGTTLLNQPAFEEVSRRYPDSIVLEETELIVKREGPLLAYKAKLAGEEHRTKAPEWARRRMIVHPKALDGNA